MKPFQFLRIEKFNTYFRSYRYASAFLQRHFVTRSSTSSHWSSSRRPSIIQPLPSLALKCNESLPIRNWKPSNIFRQRRRYSAKRTPNPPIQPTTPDLSFSQRFRKLSREYGWSVMGVYFFLSAIDFPLCFAAVRWLGVERVGHAERVVVEGVRGAIPEAVKDRWRRLKKIRRELVGLEQDHALDPIPRDQPAIADVVNEFDHGVVEAAKVNNSENASIWTQLALAYAIHKSFIFIRVPITVAVTPKVVKVLRSWGWEIGKRRPRGIKPET